ncbi:energy transducer TonB [Ferruginivarius sediminum]|uniref:Protein TonB n=1 Tax=Ferruginivarius sediminum TaxID=2661937 RepID=A0A369TCL9_9PROT|nr:energy transducer TonB [Ferruginivarius sediminum]RDD63028.1 energy transducer TonB [Ferruginivarius sediminum]
MTPDERPVPRGQRALPARRGRVAAAAAVSLLLHAGLALAFVQSWGSGREVDVGGKAIAVTLVTGPLGGASGREGTETAEKNDAEEAAASAAPPKAAVKEAAKPEAKEPTGPQPPVRKVAKKDTAPPKVSEAATPPPADPTPEAAPKPELEAPRSVTAEATLPAPPRKPEMPARKTASVQETRPPEPPAEPPRERAKVTKEPASGGHEQPATPHPATRRQLASLNGSAPAVAEGEGNDGEDKAQLAAKGNGETGNGTQGAGRQAAAPAAGNPAPSYPTRARRRGWEGRVVLEVAVAADGTVKAVEVRESSGYAALDRAALDAVRGWRFSPASEDGTSVADKVSVPVRFALRDD